MSGLTVHYELGHNQQQSFLSEYDTQIELVTEVEDMISNWSNKAVEERKAHFEALSDLFLKASSHASSIVSQAQQIVYDVENVKLKELDQREAEYHHKTRQIQAKRIVAVAGIIVGLAILMALVVSAASPKVKRRRGSRAQARHNPNKRKGRQKR